jgi:hypothetical protein
MPHRGRLNLLTDLLEYDPAALFHKIKGGHEFPEEMGAAGDVLSHLGRPFVWYQAHSLKGCVQSRRRRSHMTVLPSPSRSPCSQTLPI